MALLATLAVAAAPGGARLQRVDHEGWQAALDAERGAIVVVDYWATWCLPCLERFPAMVEMARKYDDDGARFLSLSLDDARNEGAVERAREFLGEHEAPANMRHYLMTESIPVAFEKLDLLGIPAVDLYDRVGRRAVRLNQDHPDDQFTEDDVERALERLLGR